MPSKSQKGLLRQKMKKRKYYVCVPLENICGSLWRMIIKKNSRVCNIERSHDSGRDTKQDKKWRERVASVYPRTRFFGKKRTRAKRLAPLLKTEKWKNRLGPHCPRNGKVKGQYTKNTNCLLPSPGKIWGTERWKKIHNSAWKKKKKKNKPCNLNVCAHVIVLGGGGGNRGIKSRP